jgi:hypothetical protein
MGIFLLFFGPFFFSKIFFRRTSNPPKGLPGSVEALEMDSTNHHHVGGTMEQRRNKLDIAIMSANPFNSDRLIRMYSNVDIYVKEGARFLFFLILLLSAYTYRRHVSDEYVKSVFMIHVGGTRYVTFSTDNIMKIHARITLTVEFIRGYIFKCLFYV